MNSQHPADDSDKAKKITRILDKLEQNEHAAELRKLVELLVAENVELKAKLTRHNLEQMRP